MKAFCLMLIAVFATAFLLLAPQGHKEPVKTEKVFDYSKVALIEI